MEQKSMTALISAFARAYHAENSNVKIINDSVARLLFTDMEFNQIAKNMTDGIGFFDPSFAGTEREALRWITDNHLSPSPLGRAAFAEASLRTAVRIGASQYLILGAGYDTFAYRQPDWARNLEIFEVDLPSTAEDKKLRLKDRQNEVKDNTHYVAADLTKDEWCRILTQNPAFKKDRITFTSILGLSYYLARQDFEYLISMLSTILSEGSTIVFDYPDEYSNTDKAGHRAQKQAVLAKGANEEMLACYSLKEIEKLLSDFGFLVYEHLTPVQITAQYFQEYNNAHPLHPITALENVNYCLAVKK